MRSDQETGSKASSLSIGIHGGEPMLYPDRKLEELLKYLHSNDKVFDIKIQKNLTVLTNKKIDLLKKYNVKVGVYFDGKHDNLRLDYKGNEVWKKVVDNIKRLDLNNIYYGLICVVNSCNKNKWSEIFQDISNMENLSTISFLPCFDYSIKGDNLIFSTSKVPSWGITPLEYQKFLSYFYKIWRNSDIKYVVEPFMSIISKKLGGEPDLCTFSDIKCESIFTLYPSEHITGCDYFERSEVDKIPLGNIDSDTELLSGQSDRIKELHMKKCEVCNVREVCCGGCISTRNAYLGTSYYEEYCTHRRELINMVEV